MKKIYLILLLSFSSFTFADEYKFSVINAFDTPEMGAIYVFNKENGSLKLCQYAAAGQKIICTKWFENDEE
jgi:hypothetical protein